MIKTHFDENSDYHITVEKHEHVSGQRGNPNKNVLKMTRNAFKLACLIARTQHSIKIYRFFLDLETYITKYMAYESEYNTELAHRTKPCTPLIEAEVEENSDIDLSLFPNIPVDSHDNITVLYLFYLKRYRALKFGMSTDLHTRAQRHYRAFGEKPGEVRLVHVIATEHARTLENSLKHACFQNGWKCDNIVINGRTQTEIIDLNKTTIKAVVDLINSFYEQHLQIVKQREEAILLKHTIAPINSQHLEIESRKIDLEFKRLEVESKRIECELECKRLQMQVECKRLEVQKYGQKRI